MLIHSTCSNKACSCCATRCTYCNSPKICTSTYRIVCNVRDTSTVLNLNEMSVKSEKGHPSRPSVSAFYIAYLKYKIQNTRYENFNHNFPRPRTRTGGGVYLSSAQRNQETPGLRRNICISCTERGSQQIQQGENFFFDQFYRNAER